MSRSEAYGYAVARIRAMEHRLIDTGMLQRMVDADELAGALKVLGETTYAKELASGEGGERYDHALEAELLATYREIASFVPDDALLDICRISYDFHNIKVILKSIFTAKSGGKKRWDLLTSLGTLPVDYLIDNIESEDFNILPLGLGQTLQQCTSQWEQTRDMVEVERILDDKLFTVMGEMAKKLEMPGVVAWVKARIDAENIRNVLRLRRFGFDANGALPFIHEGGTLGPDVIVSLITEQFDSWGRILSFSNVGTVLGEIHDTGDFDELIVALEKSLDEYCLALLANSRYTTSAPENVLAYIWSKEIEVKNIRTILVSKSMNSDNEEVRRLLRHGYF